MSRRSSYVVYDTRSIGLPIMITLSACLDRHVSQTHVLSLSDQKGKKSLVIASNPQENIFQMSKDKNALN